MKWIIKASAFALLGAAAAFAAGPWTVHSKRNGEHLRIHGGREFVDVAEWRHPGGQRFVVFVGPHNIAAVPLADPGDRVTPWGGIGQPPLTEPEDDPHDQGEDDSR